MEDYNTATLPHKKYYNLERHHAKEAARAAKHGGGGDEVRAAASGRPQRRARRLTLAPGAHGLWQG